MLKLELGSVGKGQLRSIAIGLYLFKIIEGHMGDMDHTSLKMPIEILIQSI